MDLISEIQSKIIEDLTKQRNDQIEMIMKEYNLSLSNPEEIKQRCRLEYFSFNFKNIERLYIDEKLVAIWNYSINLNFQNGTNR